MPAVPNSPALHRRHDRDFLARIQLVIAIDKFQASADQNAFVMSTKRRSLRINLFEQFANSRALRNLELQLAHSDQVAQLSIKLHSHFHMPGWSLSHLTNVILSEAKNLRSFIRIANSHRCFSWLNMTESSE